VGEKPMSRLDAGFALLMAETLEKDPDVSVGDLARQLGVQASFSDRA
jgi:hypothetical protein